MSMRDLISAHLAAWKAFQVAPAAEARRAEVDMSAALDGLLSTPCQSADDAKALMLHLDWYVKEEACQVEPAAVALLAAMRWAST